MVREDTTYEGEGMITGEQVLADRKARKMSRKAYAELVGVTQTQLHNIEHGRALKGDEEAKFGAVVSAEFLNAPDTPATAAVAEVMVSAGGGDVVLINEDDLEEEDDEDGLLIVEATESPPPTSSPSPAVRGLDDDRRDGGVAIPVNVRLISNSELWTFRRCKRRWWLGWYRHLRLKQERPVGARSIGSWVHKALERKYVPHGQVSEDPRDALERVLTEVYTGLSTFLEQQAKQANVEYIDAGLLDAFKKDADLARAMIEGYVQWCAETGADEGIEVISPEAIITAPIDIAAYARDVAIIAKIDVRVRRALDGVRFFIDHKTVGDLTSPVKTIHMNTQMLHYMLIERSQPEDTWVEGALYNMLRKVKRTERATPPFYQRVEVRHNPHELVAYNTHMMSTTDDMLTREMMLDAGFDPQVVAPPSYDSTCAWQCDFFAVCNMFDDGSRAEDMVAQYYKQTPHLDYYGVVNDEKGE